MRLFVSISIPNTIKTKLSQIQDQLKQVDAQIKFVEMENLHICLRFLGDIDTANIEAVKKALNKSLEGQKSLDIKLSNIGVFPNMEYIRVIWIGVQGKLNNLVQKINNKLSQQGFAQPDKPFRGHLTLGRVRSAKNKEKLVQVINNMKNLPDMNIHVNGISLISSVLRPEGPVYNTEARFEFDA